MFPKSRRSTFPRIARTGIALALLVTILSGCLGNLPIQAANPGAMAKAGTIRIELISESGAILQEKTIPFSVPAWETKQIGSIVRGHGQLTLTVNLDNGSSASHQWPYRDTTRGPNRIHIDLADPIRFGELAL